MSSSRRDQLSERGVPRRKYKRHPKPDPNAPSRPLTAFVRFTIVKRRQYQHLKLSFAALAKRIGDEWQRLSATARDEFIKEASADWKEYRVAVARYRHTPEHEEYLSYLREFARQNPDSYRAPTGDDDSHSPTGMLTGGENSTKTEDLRDRETQSHEQSQSQKAADSAYTTDPMSMDGSYAPMAPYPFQQLPLPSTPVYAQAPHYTAPSVWPFPAETNQMHPDMNHMSQSGSLGPFQTADPPGMFNPMPGSVPLPMEHSLWPEPDLQRSADPSLWQNHWYKDNHGPGMHDHS